MKKVLIIEDNNEIRENTAEILELANYETLESRNGKEGIEKARAEKPDVILCDIMMPEIDGYGVLKVLTRDPNTTGIPFIFLTAKTEREDMRKGMTLGADDYITKPFSEAELLEAIEVRLKKTEDIQTGTRGGVTDFLEAVSGLESLKELSLNKKERLVKKKESVYREGEYANYIYCITSGKVKCIKSDSYGKEFVSAIHGEGDFIGYISLLEGDEYQESAIAIEDVSVIAIKKDDFFSILHKDHDAAIQFIKMLSGEVKEKEKRLLQLAYASVRERTADALISLTNTEDIQAKEPIDFSRADLASVVGTAKESLIRTLSELKKEGIIEIDKKKIFILNTERLKQVANGFL